MSGSSPTGWQLVTLRPALNAARDWLTRAVPLGIYPALRAALLRIHDHLTNDPLGWGNPLFSYRRLGIKMFQGIEWNISVTYGVDVTRRLVYLRGLQLLPGNPLNAPSGGASP